MTKQELEKAIENGKNVWYADYNNGKVWKINLNEKYKPEIYLNTTLYVYHNTNDRFQLGLFIKNIYKTKAEAEHYLHHANVIRTETLPFLTWEEFLEKRCFYFTNYSDYYGMDTVNKEFSLELNVSRDKIILFSYEVIPLEEWEATEANFYKAYDECVRLFRGEE